MILIANRLAPVHRDGFGKRKILCGMAVQEAGFHDQLVGWQMSWTP
jgi:hypothetical protein